MNGGNRGSSGAEGTNAPVVPAAGTEPPAAKVASAPAADQVHWEFRLTADRRRILVLVK